MTDERDNEPVLSDDDYLNDDDEVGVGPDLEEVAEELGAGDLDIDQSKGRKGPLRVDDC